MRSRKIEDRTTEKKKDKETEDTTAQKKRKQILGEATKSGSHKEDECANENTMDVPNTRNVLIKRNRWQAFANAFKKSSNTKLSWTK